MNRPIILVFGFYGEGNLGDELLLHTLIQWAQDQEVEVIALSVNPAHTSHLHGIKSYSAYDLPQVAEVMMASSLFVLGGGGLFQDHHKFTLPALYGFNIDDISVYARPVLMANQMRVPTLLWAQGVGPLTHRQPQRIVREIFELATYVTLRDEASLTLLKSLGVSRQMLVAPDPCWAYPLPDSPGKPEVDQKRIAIILRPWEFTTGWEDRFVKAIHDTIPVRGTTLVWLPFRVGDLEAKSASHSDYPRRMMQRIDSSYSQELINTANIDQTIQILAGCDAAIAMRMHAQILAVRLGLPTLCLEYDPKMSAVSIQAKVPSRLRVQLDHSQTEWNDAFSHWLQQVRIDPLSMMAAENLSQSALIHQQLLETAIQASRQSSAYEHRLSLNNFDWLESWAAAISQELGIKHVAQIHQINQLLAERDTRITDLELILAERDARIDSLSSEIAELKSSTSWKITRPLRGLRRMISDPKRVARHLARSFLGRMPPLLRHHLQQARRHFPRLWGLRPYPHGHAGLALPKTPDLSWDDFNHLILANRENYKGIFVQELNIEWNVPLFQRPQHIAAAFGRLGYLVIYMTNNWSGDDVNGFREVSKNVWITNRPEVALTEGVVRSFYSTAFIQSSQSLLKFGRRGILVYEYIDHIDPRISGAEHIQQLLNLKDFAFGGGADYIVASARGLYDEAVDAIGREKVLLVQNGVDARHYRNPAHSATVLPRSLTNFRAKYRHIVGYFGALAPWLWYEVITELVGKRGDLGFVFIGPDYFGGAQRLPSADNLLYIGAVDYQILPAYARQFDVCFIPFAPGDIARTTSPLKLFEYFALEKPVVVTHDMIECTSFDEVLSGDSADSLSTAIDQALVIMDAPGFKDRLAKLADDNDWDQRVRDMEVVFKGISYPQVP
jgi:polysaccharide pyruvyl transferase CsaB